MVDVVSPHAMPSESEIHVARCFLTKILRSSMRKNRFKGNNDSSSRPHSWHSSKLKEEESESPGTPVPVWQPKEARSKESSFQVDQNNQHLLTGQLSSMNSMEKLERPAHPFPADCSSQTKYTSITEPLSNTQSRRDAFSCFSGGSSPPFLDPSLLGRKGTSIENIFFKGFAGEGSVAAERPKYLQALHLEGSWLDEQNSSRMSSDLRPSAGPLWQVPEKKSQSPPPPLPMHSDSFAAKKVFPYSEGSERHRKTYDRLGQKLTESNKSLPEKNSESRRSFTPLSDKELLHPSRAGDHNQPRSKKHFSLSSTDVRLSHYTNIPVHQRQYSDDSPFYTQTRVVPPTNIQSVGSYYRSLQDLPMKTYMATTNTKRENRELNRYSGLVNKSTNHHMPYKENKEHIGPLRNVLLDHQISEHSHCHGPQDAAKRSERHTIFPFHLNNKHFSLSRLHDPWVPQEDHRISSLRTPFLHSLAQESRIHPTVTPKSTVSPQSVYDSMAPSCEKVSRRSDRYATTLRNEVKQKRVELQKSRSAATLSCNVDDADLAEWKSAETSTSCSVSSSNTYKDNLKEAQARVLKATSFQRRDLEPFGADAPVLKTTNGRVRGRKRFPLAKRTHSFSEPDKIDRLGMDREHQVASFDQMELFEAKPSFSKPVKPVSKSSTDLNPSGGNTIETKDRTPSEVAEVTHLSREASSLNPPWEEVQQDQQRLGTFAEYQASWSKQKRTSEAKIQGRYYSAENILDSEAEEKAVCFHERSRSSPSADFHTQNSPSLMRNPQAKQSNDRKETPVPGTTDHLTGQDAVRPADVAVSSGPHSLSPVLDSQHAVQPPQANAVSPSHPHLGPETTSSSQDFLSESLEDPAMLQPSFGLETQQYASIKRPTPAECPHFCRMPGSDRNDEEPEKIKEQSASITSAVNQARSPSPQLSPLRLTDKRPAVSAEEDSTLRSENDFKLPEAAMDGNESITECSDQEKIVPPSDMWWSPSSNISDVISPHGEASPSSRFVCSHQPTVDRGPGSVKGNSLELGLMGGEAKREQLVRDIMGKNKSLVDILDHSGRKTTMDLMEGIFPSEERILEGAQQRRKTSNGSRLPIISRREEDDLTATGSLVPSSSYYNTSAPKAELLIKMKDMKEQFEEQESEDELDVDLASKKHELISSLAKKLEVLREARQSLQEDIEDNDALGFEVETTVQRVCLPNQLDKFRMFVGDLDKVVSLLLSLSGRLARVENALNSLEDDTPPEEKRTLTEKRKLLIQQHEDAKELKENLDRRECLVSAIMEAHLDTEHLDDYHHFVKMKSALIIEQRKLEDKIKLGEEQLKCLLDSLPLEQRPWL
ncbi:protein Shroom2-like isoform X2 [Dunckerocampus dactyliophorus]|nr:protein Shroom2-like isoform X2 [Dunckerocampus dactyliophorus]XP_054636918.1 protein Shroom2-like isoform X2 [Dunckerocampus dactyliophorus]XP_054636928.1 protein Shroom2-like isoform X2 [Dunckerocampus dactyliophorus]XP_054636936.1 protein Shroom2-like isoform X2 [Dunckerocampus dactyliophorus]XP_054636945.1 protein Shroom2-like isoform X2 [Dunckerocampus dactyliophorus]